MEQQPQSAGEMSGGPGMTRGKHGDYTVALPEFKSHKIVQAAKIVAIDFDGGRLDLMPHGVVEVDPSWMARNQTCAAGGWFVRYSDGYTSYSPAKAFEEGYTRVSTDPNRQAGSQAQTLAPDERAVRTEVIANCIIEARTLAANPERMYTERSARAIIDGLLAGIDSSSCFAKALANGEEVFVLRSIDMAAPHAIRAWAGIARQQGCGIDKTMEADAMADRWDANKSGQPRKWPD